MPRPSKFDQPTADKIVSALKAGNTLRASALYVGVSEDTLARWRKRFAGFAAQIHRAEAEAEVRYAAILAKAAQDGDWRAAIAWLERRRHDDWGDKRTVKLEVDKELERALDALGKTLKPEEYARVLGALATGDTRAAAA